MTGGFRVTFSSILVQQGAEEGEIEGSEEGEYGWRVFPGWFCPIFCQGLLPADAGMI